MLKVLGSRNAPLLTIQKLIKERYKEAKAVFWAGSVSQNQATDSSDLDLNLILFLNHYHKLNHKLIVKRLFTIDG